MLSCGASANDTFVAECCLAFGEHERLKAELNARGGLSTALYRKMIFGLRERALSDRKMNVWAPHGRHRVLPENSFSTCKSM